jgi:hypothetical protein
MKLSEISEVVKGVRAGSLDVMAAPKAASATIARKPPGITPWDERNQPDAGCSIIVSVSSAWLKERPVRCDIGGRGHPPTMHDRSWSIPDSWKIRGSG